MYLGNDYGVLLVLILSWYSYGRPQKSSKVLLPYVSVKTTWQVTGF
jgi:hypothetical protein